MLLYILILLGGFIALYLGAKLLIRGGTGFATAMRVKPILIGLTVVALGTSLPELTVGVVSASKSVPGLSIGNIIGSNICNILLIFGVMSLIRPLRVSDSSQRGEMPAVLASGALLWIFASILPSTKGPRSLIFTTTVLPFSRFVTLTFVPKGRVL